MRHLGGGTAARALATLSVLLPLLGPTRAAGAASCTPRARTAVLQPLWQKLDGVRGWRAGFSLRYGDLTVPHGKSYRQMLDDYHDLPRNGGGPDPLQVLPTDLVQLAGDTGFRAFLARADTACEATNGLQEVLNEAMAGQLLAGNDRLLRGLRVRYPKIGADADPRYDNDPTRLLRESVAIFKTGIDAVVGRLGEAPGLLRAGSRVNPDFPVWVENTPKPPSAQGELVENDFYQLTQLVLRHGVAESSYGRRAFFLGNDKPDKREAAAQIVKRAAHTTYLHSALLAAVQTPHDFQQNFGTELRGVISDSQDLFDDIRKGVNPLRQSGDFVPDASLPNLVSNARTTWSSALAAEQAAKANLRQYDLDFTALQDELQRQQGDGGPTGGGSLKKVYDEIGLTIDVNNPVWTLCDALDLVEVDGGDPRRVGCADQIYDLRTEEGQNATLLLGWDQASGNDPDGFVDDFLRCDADICVAHQEWVQSGIDVDHARKQLDQLTAQIGIEDERNRTVHMIVNTTGELQRGLDIATAVASILPDIGFELGTEITTTTTFSPGGIVAAFNDVSRSWLDVMKESSIEDAEHVATVRNLQLQVATLLNELQGARQAQTIARNRYTALIGDLQWILAGFARAQKKLARQYYTNPAYRMQLDEAQLNADLAFESAMIQSYLLAKRLEYEWSERLINPVPLVGSGNVKPIGGSIKYNPVTTAESAFAASSVGGGDSPELSLRTYLEALQLWDTELRNDSGRPTGEVSTKRFSLREQLLGIVGDPEFERAAFRRYVSTHRVPGLNPSQQDLVIEFGVPIDDEQLFPFVPNLRLESMDIDLRSAPGNRSVLPPRGPNERPLNPPQVELLIGGQATMRSFAATQSDDRTFVRELESPDDAALQQSQFYTLAQARVDGVELGPGPFVSTGLKGRSPAATRWLLRIKMSAGDNTFLRLENLDDILITFTTRWGEPQSFPEIFPVP